MASLSYLPLARKYRPVSFSDVVGQQVTVTALANSITAERLPAAIIFSGVRGVGKTTLARIMARALNCESGPTTQPCGVCKSCQMIGLSHHPDVLEIDGASNNGVDEIRDLQDTLSYLPQLSSYKVYIIDEVHMLSISAFNALLKTLEEPPEKVIFVFATTELQKVPETVVGRCQTYFLGKISRVEIAGRLSKILDGENIGFDQECLDLIAASAEGSLRDSITLLEQALALGSGQLKQEEVFKLLGYEDQAFYDELIQAVLVLDVAKALELIEGFDHRNGDYGKLIVQLASRTRHKMLAASAEQSMEFAALFRMWVGVEPCLSGGAVDRLVVENGIFEWVLSRSRVPVTVQPEPKKVSCPKEPRKAAVPEVKSPPRPQIPPAATASPVASGKSASWEDLVAKWRAVQPIEARKLEEARLISFSPNRIELAVESNSMAAELLTNPQTISQIEANWRDRGFFDGTLSVVDEQQSQKIADAREIVVEESIADRKEKAQIDRQNQLKEEAANHSLVRACLKGFGGKIDEINVL